MPVLWNDRKRILGMPITFTKYSLTERHIMQDKGLLTAVHDEVQLFRVSDVKVVCTLADRIFGCGTIILYSSDRSHGEFHIHSVKDPMAVKDAIMERVDEERRRNRVINNDMFGGEPGGDDCGQFGCGV